MAALVAEIVVGMVLGPPVLDVVPYVPALTIIGQLGLLLLVLEGGINIELQTLKKIGWKAFAIAISGTTLPVLACIAVLPALPPFSLLEALAAGTALSSTAIGMAAKLMQDMKLMQTRIGQIICCAAMIDDVASLILLAMISSIALDDDDDDAAAGGQNATASTQPEVVWGPTGGAWSVLIPLVSSLSFIGLSTCFAVAVPRATQPLLDRLSGSKESERAGCVLILAIWVTVLTLGAHYARTTFLLGCFMGGVSFASVPRVVEAFEVHVPPVSAWTSRIFFASIGFAVPATELFSGEALGYGALLTLIAILTKVVTGVFEWESKFSVGWAMVGRGELGLVMAEEAFRTGLTDELTFAATVWALLIATLISPLIFRQLVANAARVDEGEAEAPAETPVEGQQDTAAP
jgi:Kef-type K+ transport system membrane component KefB